MSDKQVTKGLCLEFQLDREDEAKICSKLYEKCQMLKDPPHVTLLYVGKHVSIGSSQIELFQQMLPSGIDSMQWKIVSVEVGKWLPAVVFLKLEFATEKDETMFNTLYTLAWKLCNEINIVPQMTNATPNSHPGCHVTIAKADSFEEVDIMASKCSELLVDLIGQTLTFYPVIMFGTERILFSK